MGEYARDDFLRTVASGWGSALVGGAWTEALTLATSAVQAARDWSTITISGTNAGVAYERLASATGAVDITAATAFRIAVGLPSEHEIRLLGRVSGAVGDPAGLGARVRIGANGAVVLELIKVVTGGTVTVLNSAAFSAGTYALNAQWRLELELAGTPVCKLRARIYPVGQVPSGLNGWITGSDTAAPGAGTYGLRISRVAPGASATSWTELGDLFVSDRVLPAFTASSTGLVLNVNSAPSSGDFTAYSWSWGDGSAASSGATAAHTYAAPGSYLVTLTATTRWGATYPVSSFVVISAPPPPPPRVLPIVHIGGADVCDELISATWATGARQWTDPLTGQTASVELRGRFGTLQGQTLTITAPTSPTEPLWTGIVDQVTEDIGLAEPGWVTTVIAMDNASFLARRHLDYYNVLERARLAARLADLRPASRITYRAKWSGVISTRYPELRQLNQPGDKLRGRSYLDQVNEALNASIAVAYTARDGAIVYGVLDAPAWSGSVPTTGVIDLDTGLDCAGHVDMDRANLDGIINRWTYGDGDAIDAQKGNSIDAYGEHAYTTPAGTLVDYSFWPVGSQTFDAMANPARSAEVMVPISELTQRAIKVEPLDLARLEGTLYTVLGVRHVSNYRGEWRAELSLNRNPWATYGANPP